jgi:hypothetical protein
MQQFDVDDELATLIERLANKRPFENLSFNDGLWRVMRTYVVPTVAETPVHKDLDLGKLLEDAMAHRATTLKKAPTPSVVTWVECVPELKRHFTGLTTWKAVCMALNIETAGDSARRKLKNWVRTNRPNWPPVPDID